MVVVAKEMGAVVTARVVVVRVKGAAAKEMGAVVTARVVVVRGRAEAVRVKGAAATAAESLRQCTDWKGESSCYSSSCWSIQHATCSWRCSC